MSSGWLLWVWFRAHRFVAAIVLALAIFAATAQKSSLVIPWGIFEVPVSIAVLSVVVSTLVIVLPLNPVFAELDDSVPRRYIDRAASVTSSLLIANLAVWPATWGPDSAFSGSFFLLLCSVGVLWAVVAGALAWAPTLTTGLGLLTLDYGSLTRPVTSELDRLGELTPLAFLLILMASVAAYIRLGPGALRKRWRASGPS